MELKLGASVASRNCCEGASARSDYPLSRLASPLCASLKWGERTARYEISFDTLNQIDTKEC